MSTKSKNKSKSDYTALKKRIKELEKDQAMFNGLMQTLPDNIYIKDLESRFIRVSDNMVSGIFNGDARGYIGKSDFDYFTEEHARPAYNDEQKIIKTGKPLVNLIEKETYSDGSFTWASTSKAPFRDDSGDIIGIIGISRDVTETKKLEEQKAKFLQKLEEAKEETDNIFKNVEEGLFLLDKDYNFSSQYSSVLETIIGEKKIAGKHFFSVLKDKIAKKILDLVSDYTEMLFDNSLDIEIIKGLNPLVEVETIVNGEKRYLTFQFKRILNAKKEIDQLIVTVNDVTREIELANSLEEEKAESKRSLEWLLLILNVEPSLLEEFVSSYKEELTSIQEIGKKLNNSSKDDLVNRFSRHVHTIKGNASLLEISFLVNLLHSIEDFIAPLKTKEKLIRKDINSIREKITYIEKMYNELLKLIDQIKGINQKLSSTNRYDEKVFIKSIERLANSLSIEYEKPIELDYGEFKASLIPEHHRLLVRDILVQMIRNSIYHGIEGKTDRVKAGKNEKGKLKLTGYVENDEYIMIFEDDGQGIKSTKIAEQLTLRGKYTENETANMEESVLINSIFEPGLSTAEYADNNAGRGVGMDLIKKKIEKIEGNIYLLTEPGKFTRFVVSIPYNQAS